MNRYYKQILSVTTESMEFTTTEREDSESFYATTIFMYTEENLQMAAVPWSAFYDAKVLNVSRK